MTSSSLHARRITLSAMFLSLSVVTQTALTMYIPLIGQSNGMRVGISGIFTVMPAILFGPLYGALVFALSDILSYLLRPMGAYLPPMTLIVAIGGFIRGALWFFLRGKSNVKMRICVAAVSILFLSIGFLNHVSLKADEVERFFESAGVEQVDTSDLSVVSRLVINRSALAPNPQESLNTQIMFMTMGMFTISAFGLFLLLADWVLVKFFVKGKQQGRIMPLFIAMIIGGVIVTTLNTVLMRETLFVDSWKLVPFSVVWIPRVVPTIIENTVFVYFVALLLGLFEKQRNVREWIQ